MNKTEYKKMIADEFYKAEIRYKALAALMKAEGIDADESGDVTPTPVPTPEPTPTPTPDPTPVSTDPEIVYKGDRNITLQRGKSVKLEIFFNNCSTSKDWKIYPNFSSAIMTYTVDAYKTSNGWREVFTVKGVNTGIGSFKICLANDPNHEVLINITVQ